MFRGRKEKKRTARNTWSVKIGATAKMEGTSYSKLIGGLKKANIKLDRKILADLAQNNPEIFKEIIKAAS